MPAPLLATKLYVPPPAPNLVVRPRLIERLNQGRGGRLTVVSASAGFGKTTLLSAWAAGNGQPTAWLALDEADGDPARFLMYLVAALQTIAPGLGEGVLAALQSPPMPPMEWLLTTLLNQLAGNATPAIPDRFVLVLDDYHVINSQPVDHAITFLAEHLPPQMHLVIASREDPSLPLARLRVRGQLTELRAAELRFTPEEAAEFLSQTMGLNLRGEDIAVLETRTEGWIAGLKLAAISLQRDSDVASFIQSFTGSHHFVLDYLLEEVLQRQPESIQAFLLGTSILNRLCGPLCAAVLRLPADSAQATLEYLEHANLFVVPLDHERYWYRYHHLFGDLLSQRLTHSRTLKEISGYHLRASEWYEENGDRATAFHHAFRAQDFEGAARLAELAWQDMDGRFQTAAWLGWVKKLPEDLVRSRPVLSTQMAWALMDAGDVVASEVHLQDAERWLERQADGSVVANADPLRSLPGRIAIARAYNAQIQGDPATTVKYAELALQQIPEGDFFERSQAKVTLGVTHWASGNLEAARQSMEGWMMDMQQAGKIVFAVASAFALADILIAQGRLYAAEKIYQQSLQLAAEYGKEAQRVTAHHHLGLALLYHEQGDDEAARQHLQESWALGEHTTLVDWPYRWHSAQARLLESNGNLEGALTALEDARRVYVRNPVPDLRPIEARKARVHLKQGRLARAQDWVRECSLTTGDAASYLDEFEHLTLVRVLVAGYQAERSDTLLPAMGLLERLLKAAEAQNRVGSLIEILIVQALAHQAQGDVAFASSVLERALALAEPEGYIHLFVDEGEPLLRLISALHKEMDRQPSSQAQGLLRYVDRLLAVFAGTAAEPQLNISEPPLGLVEPLSSRELEVLRLVAQGLSNAEISQRLFLAVSTVKGHNLRIFAKLQAQSRTEAVARARQLGLL